jgi:membrane fusion protein, peptide pheromone/bacteriocin exporter
MKAEEEVDYEHMYRESRGNVFLIVCGFCLAIGVSLPFIYVSITMKKPAVIRPILDQLEVRSPTAGIISSLFHHRGFVNSGDVLFVLDTVHIKERRLSYDARRRVLEDNIHDLENLLSSGQRQPVRALRTRQFRNALSEHLIKLSKHRVLRETSGTELALANKLSVDGLIAPHDLFIRQLTDATAQRDLELIEATQITQWQQQLEIFREDLRATKELIATLNAEAEKFTIRSPVTGSVVISRELQKGSAIFPGDVLCIISPDTSLIAECAVDVAEKHLLRRGGIAEFTSRVSGMVEVQRINATILTIDDDIDLTSKTAMVRIRCAIASAPEFKHVFIKGLTGTLIFRLSRRSLWQLLKSSVTEWFQPTQRKTSFEEGNGRTER